MRIERNCAEIIWDRSSNSARLILDHLIRDRSRFHSNVPSGPNESKGTKSVCREERRLCKMKRRVLFFILTLILSGLLFPRLTPAKPIVWRLQTYGTGKAYSVNLAHLFKDTVEKRSQGRLQIDLFEAGVLGFSGTELGQVVGRNLVQGAQTMAALLGTEQPAWGASSLPFIFSKFDPEFNQIGPRLAVEEGEAIFQEMAKKMNLHYFNGYHMVDELECNKKVAAVQDWRGLKLRSWSPLIAQMGKALGSTNVTIPVAEMYTSFATRVIDANVGDATSLVDNKRYEVVKYLCSWPAVAAHFIYIINEAEWRALDKDLQSIVTQALRENSREGYEYYWVKNWEKRQEAKKFGVEIVKVSPEEIKKVRNIMKKEVWEPWIAGAGEYGRKLYDIILKYE